MADDTYDEPQTLSRDQLRRLLEQYFEGPIDNALISRLTKQVGALLGDTDAQYEERRSLLANQRDYRGQAWREQLSPFGRAPRPIELAAWLVATNDGYPAPLPYCPEPLVGTWDVIEPHRSRWVLSATGTFHGDDEDLREHTRWCVFRREYEHGGGLVDDSLRIDGYSELQHTIEALSSSELRLRRIQGYGDPIPYRLKRVG